MLKLPWKKGRLRAADGPLVVSATRFTYRRHVHMAGVFWNGWMLRAAWPSFEGGVGVSISADLARRSTYTVSVWRSEQDLRAFVAHPAHLSVMKRYRSRLESSSSATWTTDHFSLADAWTLAKERVTGIPSDV
jgi:hypothetical protein